ncbi:MAG: hypothetical protein B7X90_08405 [Novosphingobium sp. 17-62-19]|nr:MAG: hypothetical protein B7X90_08405 [Novosphingobium sp. 17-62-19]HQS95999.1 hypothetical protein [Novosphingobium sp.]
MTSTDALQVKQAVPYKRSTPLFAWERTAPPPKRQEVEPQAPIDPVYGDGMALDYKGRSIRAIPVNGVPWFALPELAEALSLPQGEADKLVHSPDFPAHARLVCYESPEPDPEVTTEPGPVTMLSPVGVWWLTALMDDEGSSGQALAAWAKREAARLCPEPAPGDPAVFLRLARAGVRPPYPWKYSGRRAEWIELRWSDTGNLARGWTPTAPKETSQ